MAFIYPPRPSGKTPPGSLKFYPSPTWIAQRKFNGTRNCIEIKNGKVTLWNRYGEYHKQYDLTNSMRKQILSLNLLKENDYYLDSELLHSKTKNIKGKIVLFDILKVDKYLFGMQQIDRLLLLEEICKYPKDYVKINDVNLAFRVTEDIWLAETFTDSFLSRYKESFDIEELEGLVLRKRKSILDNVGRKDYNVSWQVRVRKQHKNYNF